MTEKLKDGFYWVIATYDPDAAPFIAEFCDPWWWKCGHEVMINLRGDEELFRISDRLPPPAQPWNVIKIGTLTENN